MQAVTIDIINTKAIRLFKGFGTAATYKATQRNAQAYRHNQLGGEIQRGYV